MTNTNTSSAAPASAAYLWPLFFASAPFVFLNFALPLRAHDVGMSATAIGGLYAIFSGTIVLLRPLVGWGLDRFGRRKFLLGAFVFYVAAMAMFAVSEVAHSFYLARLLQGMGAAVMWVTLRTMTADLYLADQRGEAMGRLTTTSVRGSMFGAFWGFTLLGMLPEPVAWVWAFAGYAVLALVALVWAWLRVEETSVEQPAAASGPQNVEWRRVMRSGPMLVILTIVVTTALSSALIEPIYLIFLRDKFDLPVHFLAAAFFPAGLVFAIVPAMAGRWSDRVGRKPLIVAGICAAALVSILLPFWPSIWFVALSYIAFAVGWAVADPALDALVADVAPPALRGRVMGVVEGLAGLGAAIGPLLGGLLYDLWVPQAAFVINGCLLLLTAAFAAVAIRSSRSERGETRPL